jgi:hypothetical protein
VDRSSVLERLRGDLTALGGEDIDAQARRVLQYVLNESLAVEVVADPSACPNCGATCGSTRSPYCGEHCREMAGFVRQFRTGLIEGWIFDPEKQVALGQVLWHLLGGGRPLRREIAPAKARERALTREEGRCQVCGVAATTVDHVGSGCNRPSNLRAVCDACCEDRAFGDPKVTEREEFRRTVEELAGRIGSLQSLRVCDDAETWDWREFLRARANAATRLT